MIIDLVILIVIDYHHDHILIMIMKNLGDGVHESARLDPLANNASPVEKMRLEIVAKIITIILGSDEKLDQRGQTTMMMKFEANQSTLASGPAAGSVETR